MFRQRLLTGTMVELMDTLVTDDDLVEFLHALCERCAELMEAAEVGIALKDRQGDLHAMASSDERMRVLELFEMQCDEGPCFECVTRGAPIEATQLSSETLTRWPRFHRAAVEAGYRQVLALPLRLRDDTIGAVSIFGEEELPAADLAFAQALADIANIAILRERAVHDSELVVDQLQGALESRIVIEQAKGMLAQHHRIPVDEAFNLLGAQSRSHNRRITDVALSIVTGQPPNLNNLTA
jgi:GAF domain-containing protein